MSQSSASLIALPEELQMHIFVKLSYLDNARLRTLCKPLRDLIGGKSFRSALKKCGHFHESLSPLKFFWQYGGLEWIGFDNTLQQWNRLPSLRTLLPQQTYPLPGELEQCFLISTSGGLLCAEVSMRLFAETIIVLNPVTQRMKVLPRLFWRGKPRVMQIVFDSRTNSYQVIVVGSLGDRNQATMATGVYSSRTGQWELKNYTPVQPSFGTSPLFFRSGAVLHDMFFCLAIDAHGYKVVLYNVRTGEWLHFWRCAFPRGYFHDYHHNEGPGYYETQDDPHLVECQNRIVFFFKRSSQTRTSYYFVCLKEFQSGEIPEPEWCDEDHPVGYSHVEVGSRESVRHDCSPCRGEAPVRCFAVVINTRTGGARKYNVDSGLQLQPLPALPVLGQNARPHLTSNPLNFSFEPSFTAAV